MSNGTPNTRGARAGENGSFTVPLLLFAPASIAIIALFLIFPVQAARGWLIAFTIISQIVLGSLALLFIDALTPTSWGRAFGPVFRSLLLGMPCLALFWIAIALNLGKLYPWAGSAANIPRDVGTDYLNAAWFLARSIVAIAGWVLLSVLLLRGKVARFTAALGLVFFGVSSYVFGYDWILSIGAPFISSSFFAEMAIQSILAALAVAALFAPAVEDFRGRTDLGGFILASALAILYFELMALIVFWYGNLPDQAQWYLDRLGLWLYAAIAAVVLGAAVPILSLLWGSMRKSGLGLRLAGISVLMGIAAHNIWLLAPLAGPLVIVCALIAAALMTGLILIAQRLGGGLSAERRQRYA